MNDSESLSHTKWECKYHIVFIPNIAKKHCMVPSPSIWGCAEELAMQRESRIRRPFDERPCAYARINSAKILGIPSGAIRESEECYPHRSDIHGKAQEFYGREFLRERVFCFDSGTR